LVPALVPPQLPHAPDDEQELVAQVSAWFGLGHPSSVKRIAHGLMSRNRQVITPVGPVAVKLATSADADAVRLQHAAVTLLAQAGLPVPVPVAGPGGLTLMEHRAGLLTVVPWAAGTHRTGLSLSHTECELLGTMLGRPHAGLANALPPPQGEPTFQVTQEAEARRRIGRYVDLAGSRQPPDAFDRLALRRLNERARLLQDLEHLRPSDQAPAGPVGWTHGDFHELQVLWHDGQVSAVLDWDRLGVRPLAAEMLRSATLLFGYGDNRGLDIGRVTAFTCGYREVMPLADADLSDALHRLWWERLCDFWHLEWHYERDDRSCDHLFISASALLAWWCGHRSEVSGAFTSR
jgi:Ser/Thr protein kinase RdoA (MazF antagonist)